MTKAEQRKETLAARRALSAEERRRASAVICARLLALPELREAKIVLSYRALPDEVDLRALEAEVLICGRRAPILGRICMDQMMADITGIDGVQVDDEAVLMGTDGDECISAEDLAKWSGTISYEILVDAANRVERVFCGCKEEGKD